jgi:RNA polymerase sigma-B factor
MVSSLVPASAGDPLLRSLPSPAAAPRRRSGPSRAVQRRNRRVEAHRDLVRPLAIHYARCSGEPSEDLIQVGLLGLIRAAELYRAATTTPFEAFARPHVRGAILHYLRDLAPRVRLPRRQAERLELLQRLERSTAGQPGRLGAELERNGLNPEQCRLLLRQRQLCRAGSLTPEQLADLPAEPAQPAGEGHAGERQAEVMLADLPENERLVVRRIVLEGFSCRRLASELGVSPMTVQRRLQRGLEGIRQGLVSGEGERLALSCSTPAGPVPSAVPGC